MHTTILESFLTMIKISQRCNDQNTGIFFYKQLFLLSQQQTTYTFFTTIYWQLCVLTELSFFLATLMAMSRFHDVLSRSSPTANWKCSSNSFLFCFFLAFFFFSCSRKCKYHKISKAYFSLVLHLIDRFYNGLTSSSSSLSSSSSICSISSSESIVPTNGKTDAILETNTRARACIAFYSSACNTFSA